MNSSKRPSVIEAIAAPLGFYVLALLIVETFIILAMRYADIPPESRMTCVYIGVGLFIVVIVIVTLLVVSYPRHLTFDKAAHLEHAKRAIGPPEPVATSSIQADLKRVELKILNTLWVKQVNRIDSWPQQRFMFRIDASDPDFQLFFAAGMGLAQRGLVAVTQELMFMLTDKGWEYCKTHHGEFGSDQWWPEEPTQESKLRQALGGTS